MSLLEGPLQWRRHDDGRVEVLLAPAVARVSLDLLACADRAVLQVSGNRITVAGQVVYRVTGWDRHGGCLKAELVEDRRSGVSGGQAT